MNGNLLRLRLLEVRFGITNFILVVVLLAPHEMEYWKLHFFTFSILHPLLSIYKFVFIYMVYIKLILDRDINEHRLQNLKVISLNRLLI